MAKRSRLNSDREHGLSRSSSEEAYLCALKGAEESRMEASTLVAHEPVCPGPLIGCMAVGVLGVVLGVLANDNTKFVRLIAQDGCQTSWKDVGTPMSGQIKCCPALPSVIKWGNEPSLGPAQPTVTGLWDSVCASNFRMEASLSTIWGAWLLPLLPLLVGGAGTLLSELDWMGGLGWDFADFGDLKRGGGRHGGQGNTPKHSGGLSPTGGAGVPRTPRQWRWRSSRTMRLGGYVALMLFRTSALYVGLNKFENWVLGPSPGHASALASPNRSIPRPPGAGPTSPGEDSAEAHSAQGTQPGLRNQSPSAGAATRALGAMAGVAAAAGAGDCDYRHLRRSKRCASGWNAADHVVLLLTHHIAVPASELAVIFSSAGIRDTGPFRDLGGWVNALSSLSAVVVVFSAAYCVRQTAAFFHMPTESLAGLMVSLVAVAGWRVLLRASSKRS